MSEKEKKNGLGAVLLLNKSSSRNSSSNSFTVYFKSEG